MEALEIEGLHCPNCYTQQVVRLIRHSLDSALQRTSFFAKKHVKKQLRLNLIKI